MYFNSEANVIFMFIIWSTAPDEWTESFPEYAFKTIGPGVEEMDLWAEAFAVNSLQLTFGSSEPT